MKEDGVVVEAGGPGLFHEFHCYCVPNQIISCKSTKHFCV